MKITIFSVLIFLSTAFAHQPVMDMAPRWAGGYGFQIRYELFGSDTYLDEYANISNQLSFNQKTMWLEGVYTWKRSVRATVKIPYHQVKSEHQLIDWGNPIKEGKGLGDIIVALPLKKYFNLKRSTGNFGVTPQIRLKTGDNSDVLTSNGGYGLSLSYSAENFSYYQLYDLYGWSLDDGSSVLGVDVNLGWHPIHKNETNTGVFFMWDGTFRHKINSDGQSDTRFHTGPQLVVYKGNIMGRIILKLPILESSEQNNLSNGTIIQTGIGFVF